MGGRLLFEKAGMRQRIRAGLGCNPLYAQWQVFCRHYAESQQGIHSHAQIGTELWSSAAIEPHGNHPRFPHEQTALELHFTGKELRR